MNVMMIMMMIMMTVMMIVMIMLIHIHMTQQNAVECDVIMIMMIVMMIVMIVMIMLIDIHITRQNAVECGGSKERDVLRSTGKSVARNQTQSSGHENVGQMAPGHQGHEWCQAIRYGNLYL